jgi:hypothetical protein
MELGSKILRANDFLLIAPYHRRKLCPSGAEARVSSVVSGLFCFVADYNLAR